HNTTIVDYAPVKIGNNVNIAPKVGIYTTIYLDDPKLRKQHYLSAAPIIIEDGVWIGGHAVIGAGVTVGKNSIIGAGSVVTGDIPANSVAVGNPARVIRKINIEDKP
ncbi:MAG: DapH/DapD/GlmU-related protein, partial [Ligilactobacillus salivarius]|nr:DapH/DapD/GlmU-related protein [Ligilactobacillus salivarius]